MRHICMVCGYVYDPAQGDPMAGVPTGTALDALPENWVCPECGAQLEMFEPVVEGKG